MSEDDDVTQEEDAIVDESDDGLGAQATTTDFSKISFFVDDATQDESINAEDGPTDSFDAIDKTDEEIDPDASLKTLDTTDDD